MGDFGVAVVRELAESIEVLKSWVGSGQQCESEGHGALDHRLTVAQLQQQTHNLT